MRRKLIPACVVLTFASGAGGQVSTLVPDFTVPTTGPDLPGFDRARFFTFDLRFSTGPGRWVGGEIELDILSAGGRLFHSLGQRDGDGDPNTPTPAPGEPQTQGNNNLLPITLPLTPPPVNDTRRYDTFLSVATSGGAVEIPQFNAPGGILSTDTRLRGLDPSGAEIPLAWWSDPRFSGGGALFGRFTFISEGDLSLAQDALHSQVFATLAGRMRTTMAPIGVPYNFTIYAAPEPGSAALLFAAAAGARAMRRVWPVRRPF